MIRCNLLSYALLFFSFIVLIDVMVGDSASERDNSSNRRWGFCNPVVIDVMVW